MAIYRRHLMEAANNQNVEQFYESEAYAPLCETQSAQSVLPPSYEDVMAAEKAILSKYAKICTSTKCCEHSQLNRSNPEQSPTDAGNSLEMNHGEDTATTTMTTTTTTTLSENGNAKPDALNKLNNQATDSNVYDDNGNEVGSSQETPSTCCVSAHRNNENSCCCVQMEHNCVDNHSEHCINDENVMANTMDVNANPSIQTDENDNSPTDTSTDYIQSSDANNNPERMRAAEKCQCSQHHSRESPVEFEILSDNGIVRMDMSKIIDPTGLPTYDAAIKLESFGYV